MAKQSRSKSALGGKKKGKGGAVPAATKAYIDKEIKKQIRRMHISSTKNGKFLVDHEFKAGEGEDKVPESEQYAVESGDLASHVGEYMGLGAPPVAPAVGGSPELSPPVGGPGLPPGLEEPVAPAPTSTVSGV